MEQSSCPNGALGIDPAELYSEILGVAKEMAKIISQEIKGEKWLTIERF
jgi:hypothetical protein